MASSMSAARRGHRGAGTFLRNWGRLRCHRIHMPTQDHTSAPSFPGRAAASEALGLVLIGLVLMLPGCRCDDDRPYTPFQVASALPANGQVPGAEPTPAASAEPAPTGLDQSALV